VHAPGIKAAILRCRTGMCFREIKSSQKLKEPERKSQATTKEAQKKDHHAKE